MDKYYFDICTRMDIVRFAESHSKDDWTYIILGRPGRTGKTYLCNYLRRNDYNAFELSEDIWDLVDYHDEENHCRIDELTKRVLIVLNKPLSRDCYVEF